MRVESDAGEPSEGITAIAQNSDPLTYFASKPVRVAEGIAIDDGTLSMAVLKRATQRDMPGLISRLLSEKKSAAAHRQIVHFDDVHEATVTSVSKDKEGALRPFPLQVDGDYIGDRTHVSLAVEPGALTIVA